MKTLKIKKLVAAAGLLAMAIAPAKVDACTNLIVGKDASADGSVILTYNNDGYAFCGYMIHSDRGRHAKGEKISFMNWATGKPRGYVDQVEYTYNVMGRVNENQVAITETTFEGRHELVNPEGILEYDKVMTLALERATNAREAVQIMGKLVEDYGYCSSGETFTVADKNEAWIMDMIGKGPGRKGAVWVALRVPDDCICAHANLSRIRQFPLNDKANCLYSKDVISFAREMGFFSGKDKDFSFRDAYCPIDFDNVRYGDARVWSFFRHHTDPAEMDKYLPYINAEFDKCDHLPLWIKPDKKLSVRDVMNDMRDHYEGTALDMTTDLSAGPYGTPIRPRYRPFMASDGQRYFQERPIGVQQTAYTMVIQLRSWLPDAYGGVMHFNCDDATMVPYVPVYCGASLVPEAFKDKYSPTKFDEKSAFWMCNFVANMVYPRYSLIIDDVREAQNELESYYETAVAQVAERAKDMTTVDMMNMLNAEVQSYTDKMMARWDKLARLIIVKHNDMMRLNSKDGVCTGWEGGLKFPGYNQRYLDEIPKSTGTRYKLEQYVERKER